MANPEQSSFLPPVGQLPQTPADARANDDAGGDDAPAAQGSANDVLRRLRHLQALLPQFEAAQASVRRLVPDVRAWAFIQRLPEGVRAAAEHLHIPNLHLRRLWPGRGGGTGRHDDDGAKSESTSGAAHAPAGVAADAAGDGVSAERQEDEEDDDTEPRRSAPGEPASSAAYERFWTAVAPVLKLLSLAKVCASPAPVFSVCYG